MAYDTQEKYNAYARGWYQRKGYKEFGLYEGEV